LIATLLVLASAALHAAWNAVLKRHPSPRLAGALILIIASLAAAVPAAMAPEVAFPSRAAVLWTLAAGLGEAAYFVTLARALDAAPLGVAYTITRGGSIVLVWPLSVLFFHERAGAWAAVGVLAVLAGLVLTGFAPASPPQGAERRGRAGVAWAAVCAVFIALVYIF
jgi:multidrug transporter EmrE-like cation transporter